MAKLYFRYGSMGSAKTLNLLAVAHNYEQQNKRTLLIKPATDNRFTKANIQSRAGLKKPADILLASDQIIDIEPYKPLQCILVDEAQFLTFSQIEQLRMIATFDQIPVICYGLRTDFKGKLFTGSHRLFELADAIEEIKTTCAYCNKKATMNMRLADGVPTLKGEQVLIGAEESYLPTCYPCYCQQLHITPKSLSKETATPL